MKTNCLSDVVALFDMKPPHDVYDLHEAAAVLVSYFKRPMHEISMSDIKAHRRYIPLYLSFVRVALEDVPVIVRKVDVLLDYALVTLPEI